MNTAKYVGKITEIDQNRALASILSLSGKRYYYRPDRFSGQLREGDMVFFQVELETDNRLVLSVEKY